MRAYRPRANFLFFRDRATRVIRFFYRSVDEGRRGLDGAGEEFFSLSFIREKSELKANGPRSFDGTWGALCGNITSATSRLSMALRVCFRVIYGRLITVMILLRARVARIMSDVSYASQEVWLLPL